MQETPTLDGLTFKVAQADERLRGLAFHREIYARDLGHLPDDEPDAVLLIALDATGAVVASFRLLPPELRPFDFERSVDVSDLLAAGRKAALIGRLCVHPDFRTVRRGAFLHTRLLKLTHAYCSKHQITDLFLYTFDHLLAFYRVAFFQDLGRPFEHPEWGKVKLMHLDVTGLVARCAGSDSPMARLLREPAGPSFVV